MSKDILLKKASKKEDYVAYYLNAYIDLKGTNTDQLLKELNCTYDAFVKLALCKVASPSTTRYSSSIRKIAEYTNVPPFILSQIIRFASNKMSEGYSVKPSLLAARTKEENGYNNKP